MSREELFLSQLAVIERVIAWVCARRGLRGADAEDFASIVKLRLIENDYEILAKYEGRSSLKTFLAAVVNRMYLDFQIQRFGKWRSSAPARRLGPVAVRLERLMFRDGLSFDEAYGVLRSDPAVTETRDALYAMSQAFPIRGGRGSRHEGHEPAAPETSASAVERAERQALAERTFRVIRRSLRPLPPRDLLLLRLHFEGGFTVAEADRALGSEQKSPYRRMEEVLKRLRADLDAEGIRLEDAKELLATLDWDAAMAPDEPGIVPPAENDRSRPSQEHGPAAPQEGEP